MFDERARDVELLDRADADPRLTDKSYTLMDFVNATGGGTRVVRDFIAREMAASPERSASVLDIGSGNAGIPLTVTQWARKHGYYVEFTCLDHNPRAVAAAQKAAERASIAHLKTEVADIFDYHPDRQFDYAIASMFLHHFSAERIDALLNHLGGFIRKALLINDLHRCALNYLACRLLTIATEPQIRHDALLSIGRGFKPAELAAMLSPHDPKVQVHRRWFCRVVAIVRFDREDIAWT